MSTKSTIVSSPVGSTDEGKADASLLTAYLVGVSNYAHAKGELTVSLVTIEISIIRQAVKSFNAGEVSKRDIQATIKAGKEQAIAKGQAFLPDLGVGSVQGWKEAVRLLDNLGDDELVDLKKILVMARNVSRLPEGYDIAGKSLEAIEADIPARVEGKKAEGNKAPRKATSRAKITISQITDFIKSFTESLPANLDEVDDVVVVEVANLVQAVSRLSKAMKAKGMKVAA